MALAMTLSACTKGPKVKTGKLAEAGAPAQESAVKLLPPAVPRPEGPEPQAPRMRKFERISRTRAQALSKTLRPTTQGLRSWKELEVPLRRSLAYVKAKPEWGLALKREEITLTWRQLRSSLEELLILLPHLDDNPHLLSERFDWYSLTPKPLMTGYYSPMIEASLTKRPGYEFPIYGVPPDLKWRRSDDGWRLEFYRVENGKRLPYYERRDLDVKGCLSGKGLEIAWARDPVDVFYLQVEGCGMLKLPDGSVKQIVYGAGNGHQFKGLGHILFDKGCLPRHRLSKKYVKEYLHKHPQKMFDFMAENRSYVFFRFSEEGAEGSIGQPLTPLVSVATDPEVLPLGAVLAFGAGLPGQSRGKRSVKGIGLAQDTGSAILGSRVDYYIGEGDRAARVASRTKTLASIHILVSKDIITQ